MARNNERIQDIGEFIERIKKLTIELTELEHRVLILMNIVEKRRKLLDMLREALEKR